MLCALRSPESLPLPLLHLHLPLPSSVSFRATVSSRLPTAEPRTPVMLLYTYGCYRPPSTSMRSAPPAIGHAWAMAVRSSRWGNRRSHATVRITLPLAVPPVPTLTLRLESESASPAQEPRVKASSTICACAAAAIAVTSVVRRPRSCRWHCGNGNWQLATEPSRGHMALRPLVTHQTRTDGES